jgi:CheY-like chemotaxis protein
MSSPSRILVADTPEAFDIFRRALTGPFTLVPAATLSHVRDALHELPDAVVCGCHFDEGRMYDVLRHLKASTRLAQVPFMAIRCLEGELELDDALYESVKIAVRALDGDAFVDLVRWNRKYGADAASAKLTQLVERLARTPPADTV